MRLFYLRAFPALFLFSCSLHPVARIETPKGNIWFSLHHQTPQHKKAFIRLAEANYWDSLCFNRVIPNFVAQGGCPDTPEGFGASPHLLNPEFHDSLRHVYGAVGAGRDDNPGMQSATCQFYIVQNKNGLKRLDGKYTVFGQVISGMDVVDSICNAPRNAQDSPLLRIPTKISVHRLNKFKIQRIRNGKSG